MKLFIDIDINSCFDASGIKNANIYYWSNSFTNSNIYYPLRKITQSDLEDEYLIFIKENNLPEISLGEITNDMLTPKQIDKRDFLLELFDLL